MINPESDQNKKEINNFAKYSGMAFQMLATIGVFTFIGYLIDKGNKSGQPLFAALLGFVGVVVSLFMIIRSLTKNK
jgi:F0F1-type ATP synthase assembly protein I